MGLFSKNKVSETLNVEGIKCEHCVARIKDSLKKVKVNCDISLQEKTVKVSFDETKITLSQIKEVIEELGFKCN